MTKKQILNTIEEIIDDLIIAEYDDESHPVVREAIERLRDLVLGT